MTNPVIVHGVAGSPYVRAVLLGFEEKGVAWRLAAMGPGASQTPAHLARMPFGRLPAIEHGDFSLYESQAILRWTDAAFEGPSLRPTDPRQAARVDQLMGINDWYVFRSWASPIGFERIVKPMFLGLPTDETAIGPALPLARTCVATLDALLGDQTFMTGDDLTLADLMLAPQAEFFAATPEGQSMLPGTRLPAWLARMQSRPSWAATTTEALRAAA
ncbi:MAG: glutathione S-transferase [Caulobacter sp.]|nr:glutathione S-transferase [Caulobacter sp.]